MRCILFLPRLDNTELAHRMDTGALLRRHETTMSPSMVVWLVSCLTLIDPAVHDMSTYILRLNIHLTRPATPLQGPGRPEPLVVHACSTTTHPQTLFRWWHMSHVYWAAHPAPVQFNLRYPSMEVRVPPVGLPSGGLLYRLYSLLGDIKFWLISTLLQVFGYAMYAHRLWNGWLVRDTPRPPVIDCLCHWTIGSEHMLMCGQRLGTVKTPSMCCLLVTG
jgi:hypothetical protein